MSERLRPLEPLTKDEIDKLTTFAAEQGRGLVHRPGYAYEMARLLERFEAHPAECHGVEPEEEDCGETDGGVVRISSRSPYVSGGASSTVEELNAVSDAIYERDRAAREAAAQKAAQKATGHDVDHEAVSRRIDDNYARELKQDQGRAKSLPGTPAHEHNFDRLHGLCRCGEARP